jgi:hypothetical protein
MTPVKNEPDDGSEGTIFGVKVKTIAFLVNKIGLPSLVVVTFLAMFVWHGPNYLDRQAAAMEKMAEAFKDIAQTETEVKSIVHEIKVCAEETKAFQKVVVEDHRAAKEEREAMLNDHKQIMSKLNGGG